MKAFWVLLAASVVLGWAQPVLVQVGPRSIVLDFPNALWREWQGSVTVAEQARMVRGVALGPVLAALGGMSDPDRLFVLSQGQQNAVALEKDAAHGAAIAFQDESGEPLPQGPWLILPHQAEPVLTEVKWIVLNWQGEDLPEVGGWPEQAALTVATPAGERTYTLAKLEKTFAALTYPGSYVTRAGRVQSFLYTGFLLADLLGNWPEEAELEVVAADGYRMRYRYGSLMDAEGFWILAFKQDGKYMPFNPGYFRLVKVGSGNPRFQSAASAKMVVRLEIRGQYVPYSLRLCGAKEVVFTRWELESAVACPCHGRTVTSTHRGQTRHYTGLPLWRLLSYVDDEVLPQGSGIKYDDAAFNWALAKAGYIVEIRGADGFSQSIPSEYLAGNDGFILALKMDGRFLSAEEGGPLLLVWDDSVPIPPGLKRVKWVAEILVRLEK